MQPQCPTLSQDRSCRSEVKPCCRIEGIYASIHSLPHDPRYLLWVFDNYRCSVNARGLHDIWRAVETTDGLNIDGRKSPNGLAVVEARGHDRAWIGAMAQA